MTARSVGILSPVTRRAMRAAPPFAPLPTAPAVARGHVRATLAEWHLGELADTTEMIASEMTANAVNASAAVQAAGTVPVIRLCLITDGETLVVECWDQAPGFPLLRQTSELAETGRGLAIIDSLTGGSWGWQPANGRAGKCVWAEIPVRGLPPQPPCHEPFLTQPPKPAAHPATEPEHPSCLTTLSRAAAVTAPCPGRPQEPGAIVPDLFASVIDVHVILRRAGLVLLLRRAGDVYASGQLCLPSGHLEQGESICEAAVREAFEETGIVLDPAAIRYVLSIHQRNPGTCDARVGFAFTPSAWDGEPVNAEPHKHSELVWAAPAALPAGTAEYTAAVITAAQRGLAFTLNGW